MIKEKKVALITGINGMDGSHLADFLLNKDYIVYGMERRTALPDRSNIEHLLNKVNFLSGDLSDQNSLFRCIKESNPDEVYNLASQSFVMESWNTPESASNITALGVLRILESIREFNTSIKFYQASSSEMFGLNGTLNANESTPFYPRSPYGISKLYGHWITKNYRESYGIFACSGILFNHESERRGMEFVTRKITNGVARIVYGLEDYINLGDINVYRDWGYAPDYVEAMWLMLQQDNPEDFVIASGQTHSVSEFIEIAFKYAGIHNWENYIKYDSRNKRPAEIEILSGDSSYARKKLGWKPTVSFEEIIKRMVENDLNLVSRK